MIQIEPFPVTLVRLVDRIPEPPAVPQRKLGRPKIDPERLIIKALIIMIIRRLYTATSLLNSLHQETALPHLLRELLTQGGCFPSRRTWERHLEALLDTLPPWQPSARAVAVDSTPLRAKGGWGHKKQCEQGLIPHSTLDIEAGWSKSGYHRWGRWCCINSNIVNLLASVLKPFRGQPDLSPRLIINKH